MSTVAANQKPPAEEHKQIEFEVALSSNLGETKKVKVKPNDIMLDVMTEGAKKLHIDLLPNDEEPLDLLHSIVAGQLGGAIDLQITASQYEAAAESLDVAIELVLAIRVNNKWKVASSTSMSPLEILALFEMPHDQYTLYNPGEVEPLPLETPIALERGQEFEAQKDGKYGGLQRERPGQA